MEGIEMCTTVVFLWQVCDLTSSFYVIALAITNTGAVTCSNKTVKSQEKTLDSKCIFVKTAGCNLKDKYRASEQSEIHLNNDSGWWSDTERRLLSNRLQ